MNKFEKDEIGWNGKRGMQQGRTQVGTAMKIVNDFFRVRPVVGAVLVLWASAALAQVRPLTGIMAHYDDVNDPNGNYSIRGAGSGDYPTGTVYNMTFNTGGAQNNLYITGFESGTNVFRFVQLASRINLMRHDNSTITGKHNIVFFEESAVAGTNVNLKPSLVTTMDNSLRSDMVNRGADNVFANQGDGNGNNNNIERIDYVFSSGFPYYNLTDRRGFVVMDRGGNDRFKIAVILSLDTNGMPATFSRPVSVSDANWGPSGITLETTVMRGYTENGAQLRPSARTSVQSLSGVYLSWDEFGLTTNDMIHGYALAANDVTTNNADWLQVTNSAYFPTNTTVGSEYGGLDLISGGAMFFDENLDVGIGDRVWDDWDADGIQDAGEPGLSNVLVHVYDTTNRLVATARSEADGRYFRQGIGPGTFTIQFFPPAGYQFSPQYARTEPELDSDPNSLTGITDPITMLVGATNVTLDAGLYQTPGDLRLGKTVSSTNLNVGAAVVYALTLTNAGTARISFIQVTDALPSAFDYSGHGASTGTFSTATGIWNVGSLAAGASATLSITGTVAAGSGGNVVTNVARVMQMDRPDLNPADNEATAVFRVQLADLSVTKATDRLAQEEGTPILFTITVTNQGPDTATGIRINDRLPTGFNFAGWYASQGTYSNATGVWHLGDLTNGGSATLEIEASAAAGSGGFYFTNVASVGYSSHEDPDAADNSDSVVVLVYGADISIDKSVNPPAASEGQTVTYTLVVTNPGPSRAPSIVVSEPLTNGLTYVGHTASQGTYSDATGVWALGALEVNSSATLQIRAMPAAGTKDTSITNRARITATGLPDPNTANNVDAAVLSVSSLVLTKASDVVNSVHPGDAITYTIVASNSGSLTHANVTLDDLVPAGTAYVPGSLAVVPIPGSETTVVYTSSTIFTAPAGVTSVTVEAWGGGGGGGRARGSPATGGGGAGGSFAKKVVAVVPGNSYTVRVGAGGIGGNGIGTDTQHGSPGSNSWFNATNVVFAQGGARGLSDGNFANGNGAAGAGSSALCVGDVVYRGGNGSQGVATSGSGYSGAGGGGAGTTGIGGNASAGTGGTGTTLWGGAGANGVGNSTAGGNGSTYGGGGSGGKANTTTDRNGGAGAAGLVRITFGANGAVGNPPNLASNWTLVPGQRLQATFQVLVDDPLALLAITNVATATSVQQGVPIFATVVDRVIHTDLDIAKSASVAELREGESLVFTLTVANQSAVDAATGVAVLDPLPAGFTFASAASSQGAYNPATGTWTVGTLAAGSSASLAIQATAATGAGGLYWTNVATISAYNQVDPNQSNNVARAVVLVQGADLGLTKTVDNPTPNETAQIVYTLRLSNSGPSAVGDIAVSEPLTNGLVFVSSAASQGSYDGTSGIWTVGSMASNGVATLLITATVQTNTFGSSITNRCRITAADLPDPVAGNNQAEAVIVVSGLRVSKTSNVSGFARPGDVIAYTITVSNLSAIAHTGIRLEDNLPTGTVYVAGSLNVGVSPANPLTNVLFTNSSSFTVPAGVTSLVVETWGGGGGGGAALGNPATGGGGAGGSYARKVVAVVPAQSYAVTVGAGGTGGTTATINGLAGSNSWFSATNVVFAQGGARGLGTSANSNNAAAGAGSSALCSGDTTYAGGNGSQGNWTSGSSYSSGAGGGGAGSTGAGGNASAGTGGPGTSLNGGNGANGVTNNLPGANGATYGGGGSGGKANTTTDQNGGSGANGLVRISYSPRGDTQAPPILASNWTLAAGGTLTATFNVTVINPGSTTQLLNTVSVTCDQQPTPVVAAVADRVVHADLGLTKTVNDVHPDEGETVTYTLVVTNLGPNAVTNILVADPLTNGLVYVSHAAGAGTYNRTTGVWSVNALAIGATAQLQISARVATNTAGTVITNRAWISGAGAADLALENNEAAVDMLVVSVDVGLGKSASASTPVESSVLVYAVSVTNFGPDVATGVAVTDLLPTNVTYQSHEAGQGSYNPASGVWTVGTLAALQTATLNVTTTVKTNTAGKAITNTATLTAVNQVDVRSTNNVARVVVTPTTALLGLTKTASPAGPVRAGDVITYTLVATNRSAVTQTNVTLVDPLPTGTVYVADSCQVTAPVTVNETFGDNFSRRVYSNNDGTELWAGDWVEGENNGPTAGFIQIQFDNGVDETYTLRYSGGSQSIRRAVNLSRYVGAQLEFDYQRIGLEAGDYVAIQISTNGPSGTFTELARFSGDATDADYLHFSQNISAYMSPSNVIRFTSPAVMDGTDIVWIDNLRITGTRRAMQTAPGGAPPSLASGQTLQYGESMTVQFQVWVANPALYNQIVNQAALTSAQTPIPQTATVITPVETCFTSAPLGLYADPTNVTSFSARWTEVSGASGYRLDVSTNPTFSSYVAGYSNRAVAVTAQAVTGLTYNVAYYFRVRAEWEALCTSVDSATQTVTTLDLPSIWIIPEELDFGVVQVGSASNLILTVTNSSAATLSIPAMAFAGTGSGDFSVLPATASIPPAGSAALTVTFAPTAHRTLALTLTLFNDSVDYPELVVPVRGIGFDPTALPPEVLHYRMTDASALTNEVADRSMAEGTALVEFTVYHAAGVVMDGASFDLIYPDGSTACIDAPFATLAETTFNGQTCQKLSVTVPRFFPAVLGVYTARVTVASSNGVWLTDEARFASVVSGADPAGLVDNFNRADVSDNVGQGWLSVVAGPVPGNVQIRNRVLQLYGPGGTGGTNGRISAVRDLSGRYAPILTNNAGTLVWAFNCYSGRTNQLGLAPGAFGAVFVLASDSTNWVSGGGNGYAVRIASNKVALASFAGGLNLDSDLSAIGTPANLLSATSSVSVKVELDAATGVWRLYVRTLAGSGIGAFGDPISGMESYLVAQATNAIHLHRSLPYLGCYWNHGNAAVQASTAAYFDDLYAYVKPETAPMVVAAIDNDIMLPTSLGAVLVNGAPVPEQVPSRFEVTWTNAPEFIVTFDPLASDQDPGYPTPNIQRDVRGIGEYRVTPELVDGLTASNRALRGLPFPVVTTNGALANYGFEMPPSGGDWILDARCGIQTRANNESLVQEGTNSLRQTTGGLASQVFEFRNAAGVVPRVKMTGWVRGGSSELTIAAYATNDLVHPVGTATVATAQAADWTAFTLPEQTLGNSAVEMLTVTLHASGGETFWDNLRFSVDIGTNRPSMRFHAGPENQGLAPQYLFGVDADLNRGGDRLAGTTKYFYIPYDVTPPTPVRMLAGGTGASTETVDDPTTQFDLSWTTSGLGPDDPDSPFHPTKLPWDVDIMSRWHSYKIYYGPFDAQSVPPGDNPNSTDGYVYKTFIQTGAYRSWNHVTPTNAIADPSATHYQSNYLALTNMGISGIRLYDLDFDQDYVVIVVGIDAAGNEGRASYQSWATNNTIKFAMIGGRLIDKEEARAAFPQAQLNNTNTPTAAAMKWIASGETNLQGEYTAVWKDYDLIHWDSSRFQESSNNQWQLVGTVRTNWFVDDGGQMLSRGQVRFYRASYKDRWRSTNALGQAQRRMASEEVYAMHNVVLSSGQNYVALHGIPVLNTFQAIFGGTETFPGGPSALPDSGSTVVEFYVAGTNAPTGEQYFLSSQGRWMQVGGGDVTDVVQPSNFFCRGFSITLPNPIPAAYTNASATDADSGVALPAMMWTPILQVPTNSFQQTIQTGSRSARTAVNMYNLVALTLPVCAHPSEMHLLESGFVNGPKATSDQIYTINTATKGVRQGSTMYCDANGVWRFVSGDGLVPWGFFAPNDVIVIVSRNGGLGNSWTWSYDARSFYAPPTRWMAP
jgi:uncharacterized repeat protein (TIGR01451 family)